MRGFVVQSVLGNGSSWHVRVNNQKVRAREEPSEAAPWLTADNANDHVF